jgi:hypothetical protein
MQRTRQTEVLGYISVKSQVFPSDRKHRGMAMCFPAEGISSGWFVQIRVVVIRNAHGWSEVGRREG